MKWVTERRPHVDRCSSAWFVRRYIDPRPTFLFIARGEAPPPGATPFDLPGARLGHRGGKVTFDAFLAQRPASEPSLRHIASLVRDIDLGRFRLPESRGLDALLYGILLDEPNDRKVFERTAPIFDALLKFFGHEKRT